MTELLEKIAVELAGDFKCPFEYQAGSRSENNKIPPYGIPGQLKQVAGRLKNKVHGDSDNWQAPLCTSRFVLMYKTKGKTQEQACQELSKLRDEMKCPTK